MARIEEKAYANLRRLRQMELWDGSAPVPIDHILEHILGLTISWEAVDEPPGRQVLACLRPETREVVLNESHAGLFREKPGVLRFSKGHEAGHADVFALVDDADQSRLLADVHYHPMRCIATKGAVSVVQSRLRELPRELRTEVMRELVASERQRRVEGEDSDLERRSVDHYAATLLMPADLVRSELEERDLTSWPDLYRVAERLGVTISALTVRLMELGLIHDIVDRRILLHDPSSAQISLL
jgi:hypothetical protein